MLFLKLNTKRLLKRNYLDNTNRKIILKDNLFNNKWNTKNDEFLKFNFRKNIIYEFRI